MIGPIQTVVAEISQLWNWVAGLVAGLGLAYCILIGLLILAYVKIIKLNRKLERISNQLVTDSRELSLRINKLEKK